MSSYASLASCYDQLTTDINYETWAKYLHQHLQTQASSENIVLDLACGTGSLTFALAELGYDMIGADMSQDMLSQAMEKTYDFPGKKPMFLCQAMENLDLFGTIDACVCCLDSINYVTQEKDLLSAFQKVAMFLIPQGVFLFDIKSPYAFAQQNGQISLDETQDVYCVWRTECLEDDLVEHSMDLFLREGAQWRKEEECHHQRIYHPDKLQSLLQQAGFTQIQQFGELSFQAPSPEEGRIFFLAKK